MTKKIFAKNIIIGSVAIIAIFGMGLYTNIIKLPITRMISPQYIKDFSDNRVLMGASHNVFVGKVIKQTGSKRLGAAPETQFAVDVILNIKGDLQGTAVVNQFGGYKNGILYLVRGGDVIGPVDKENADTDFLLNPGVTYLFTTRYNSEENWHTATSHPSGRKVISRDVNLDRAGLEMLAQNDEKVAILREAYKNEILLDEDVKQNNARNSYQSLQKNR